MKQIKEEPTLEDILLRMREAMTAALMEESKKMGYSLQHFEILRHIGENETLTMKEIAKKMHITPPSASTLVDTLTQKGLVLRKEDVKDRRTVQVTLTAQTFKLFFDVHKKKECVFNAMLSKLDAKDKSELMRILHKCII